ncbi:MAG: acyl-CoA thioesterase [Acidimicrobiales bacterium]
MEPTSMMAMMTLEHHGPDTFVGVGPRYPWGGLYGGHIVAQSLRAAALTVEERYRVHSLHAYFIRKGDQHEPIRFEVDRLRNGRSFVTRAVVARQAAGAILNLSASFQLDEEATDVQSAIPPPAAQPDGLEPTSWSELFDRRWTETTGRGRATAWMKVTSALPALTTDVSHACALAYLSDDLPTDAVFRLHPEVAGSTVEGSAEEDWFGTSLDHAMWFHRPAAADAWTLWDFQCDGLLSSRGLAVGHAFGADGAHVATVAQEVLMRRRRQ